MKDSRRDLLKGAAVGGIAATVLGAASASAAPSSPPIDDAMKQKTYPMNTTRAKVAMVRLENAHGSYLDRQNPTIEAAINGLIEKLPGPLYKIDYVMTTNEVIMVVAMYHVVGDMVHVG